MPPESSKPHNKRECHKCPRSGKGDDYCWKVCMGPADDSNKGVSKVTMGGLEAPGEYIRANLDDAARAESDSKDGDFAFFDEETRDASPAVTATLTEDTERNMVVVISTLFALPDIQLCILKHLLFGEDYASIGRSLPKPMSKEAVFKHITQMKRRCGFFAKIMRDMQSRGVGGARRRRALNMEFDFA